MNGPGMWPDPNIWIGGFATRELAVAFIRRFWKEPRGDVMEQQRHHIEADKDGWGCQLTMGDRTFIRSRRDALVDVEVVVKGNPNMMEKTRRWLIAWDAAQMGPMDGGGGAS